MSANNEAQDQFSAGNEKAVPPPSYGFQDPGDYPRQEGMPRGPPPAYISSTTVMSQPMGHATTFQSTMVIPVAQFGPDSTRLTCPHCRADVSTKVNYSDGTMTHVIAAILCIVGCWPCCLIPYCVDGCKNAEHVCPNCNRHIGMFRRM